MRHTLFSILLFILSVPRLWSMPMTFVNYNVDSGLSHNHVRCIIQDRYGFIWLGTPDGLNRFDGREFLVFKHDPANPASIGSNSILSLYEDKEGILWTGTSRGLYRYDPSTGEFSRFTVRTGGNVLISTPVNVITGRDGKIWIGTDGQGVFLYDPANAALVQNSTVSLVRSISPTDDGAMWVGGELGAMAQLDRHGKRVTLYNHGPAGTDYIHGITAIHPVRDSIWYTTALGGMFYTARLPDGEWSSPRAVLPESVRLSYIFQYSDRQLLAGGPNTLITVDRGSGRVETVIDKSTGEQYDRTVNTIYRDREGGLWIATRYNGVDYVPRELKVFDSYVIDRKTVRGAKMVNAFCYGGGLLWIGTEDDGLVYIDPDTHHVTKHPATQQIESAVRTLMFENGSLWIGTENHGIYVFDIQTGNIRRFVHSRDDINTISDNTVNKLYRDSRGFVYAGTPWGLSVYDPQKQYFERHPRFGNHSPVSDILEDRQGNLWFTTYGLGIERYNPAEDTWRYFPQIDGRLPSNHVICISEDEDGVIWIGTVSGICRLDYSDDRIVGFDTHNRELAGKTVYSIEHEKPGILWLATNTGLICVDVTRERIINTFTRLDGLQSTQFNARASFRRMDGRMFFGGINGFNSFLPGSFYNNNYIPGVYITSVEIDTQLVDTSGPGTYSFGNKPSRTTPIKLGSREHSITFGFAALSYQLPLKNRYQYKLDGWDTDWLDAGNRNRATYENLPAGKYRFFVRGSNNDGIWNSHHAVMPVRVFPPFYRSATAVLIYILMFFGAAWASYRYARQRQQRKMREFKTRQEQMAYKSKIELFTNLAHEIRTPLSLIKLPVEHIINSGDGKPQTRDYLDIIDRNTTDLLNLVNEILDFRKSEENGFTICPSPLDIRDLVRGVASNFEPTMKLRGIVLETVFTGTHWEHPFDESALSKVLTNLLSNAGKYARTRVVISAAGEEAGFTLTVEDDGPGVESHESSKIFDTFYQSEGSAAGTGLGLSLAKRLTQLHGGSIRVEQSELSGARFIVNINTRSVKDKAEIPESLSGSMDAGPIVPQTAEGPAQLPTATPHIEQEPASPENIEILFSGITLLIVEDNVELMNLIAGSVASLYRVHTASNGIEALSILDKEEIDIVVSDLMMPQMDGYELCRRIKEDIRYCHIPVISLTAKAGIDDQIKGLEYGADAYITKPFSLRHLTKQIDNLLGNRKRLHDHYRTSPFPAIVRKPSSGNKDAEFIEKLNREIAARIQDENFYIDDLASVMFMSRSNFYRKIKALFGVSPNEYLKGCRLRYAAELLTKPDIRISQVFVEAGFNSNSYFSKCFREHFGMTPTQYAAQYSVSE